MKYDMTAFDLDGVDRRVSYDTIPDHCPFCHQKISVKNEKAYLNGAGEKGRLQILYRCPNRTCGMTFFAFYERNADVFRFQRCAPGSPDPISISEHIAKISPDFGGILNQANSSEQYGLDQIAGPGYRKALEFLVKDYAIANSSDLGTKDRIKKMQLADCIKEFVQDPVTKEVAKRAAWLGNDESHYFRKWETKDITDLKKLIQIVMHALESEALAKEYVSSMPTP